MAEMYPTNTVTIFGSMSALGDVDLVPLLYTKTPSNVSHVCVIDSVTWAYNNTSAGAATLQLDVCPGSSTVPQWTAYTTVPAGETATIDKNFVHGMPLWRASTTAVGSDPDEFRSEHNGNTGSQLAGSGANVYGGSIRPYIDGALWRTSTPHGPGVLSVTYHMEPASCRKY